LATVGDALLHGREVLVEFGDEGRFDALRLLEEILERNAAWIFAHGDERLGDAEALRYARALATRATGVPVAYIVGSAGFFGRTFAVTRDVLVPRPETEGVVEFVLAAFGDAREAPFAMCDLGTGSGIIAITLACERSHARITALDVSPAALSVAERNARAHDVAERMHFIESDMWDALAPEITFDCIVANLPYVRRCDLKVVPDATAFEPVLALDGGDDGLDSYRALLAQAPKRLRAGGLLVMEAGPDTVPALAMLAEAAFAEPAIIEVHRDFALHERIVVVRGAR
jgi:release factor glutamine methyltransferase